MTRNGLGTEVRRSSDQLRTGVHRPKIDAPSVVQRVSFFSTFRHGREPPPCKAPTPNPGTLLWLEIETTRLWSVCSNGTSCCIQFGWYPLRSGRKMRSHGKIMSSPCTACSTSRAPHTAAALSESRLCLFSSFSPRRLPEAGFCVSKARQARKTFMGTPHLAHVGEWRRALFQTVHDPLLQRFRGSDVFCATP